MNRVNISFLIDERLEAVRNYPTYYVYLNSTICLIVLFLDFANLKQKSVDR